MLSGINSLTMAKMQALMRELGQPAFRAKQVFTWLHQKNCTDYAQMTNIPEELRSRLQAEWPILQPEIVKHQISRLDGTQKMLLQLQDGSTVETVLMQYNHGHSVCVSTQAGCRMGCAFCASTRAGLARNLTPAEMLCQLMAAQQNADGRVSNLVLMGMGEPLDNLEAVLDFLDIITHESGLNLSMRNITLSTCGVVPGMYELARHNLPLTLSISLHGANDQVRTRLMPVNKSWPLAQLMQACRDYRASTGRRLSFEYGLFAGVNDSPQDARELVQLLKGTDSHVNLIFANGVEGTGFAATSQEKAQKFKKILSDAGVQVTIRRRLGTDIDAACGQLRMRHEEADKYLGEDET